jgi:IS5 family transposase
LDGIQTLKASLVFDKGYGWMELREKLREECVKPLIKHREFRSIDHAHNARIDGPCYHQRVMCEAAFSTIKRTVKQ